MKLLPNLFTLANAAVGCFALYYISVIDFETATYCVLICCVFDFFDGFFARALGTTMAKALHGLRTLIQIMNTIGDVVVVAPSFRYRVFQIS